MNILTFKVNLRLCSSKNDYKMHTSRTLLALICLNQVLCSNAPIMGTRSLKYQIVVNTVMNLQNIIQLLPEIFASNAINNTISVNLLNI